MLSLLWLEGAAYHSELYRNRNSFRRMDIGGAGGCRAGSGEGGFDREREVGRDMIDDGGCYCVCVGSKFQRERAAAGAAPNKVIVLPEDAADTAGGAGRISACV